MADEKKAFADRLYYYAAQVLEVVDGDTLRVDLDYGMNFHLVPKLLRLEGINTPESRTTDLNEKMRGMAAKSYLMHLAPVDSWILVKTVKDHDEKYGRLFGEVWAEPGAKSLNQQMIDAGHALPWDGQGKKPI